MRLGGRGYVGRAQALRLFRSPAFGSGQVLSVVVDEERSGMTPIAATASRCVRAEPCMERLLILAFGTIAAPSLEKECAAASNHTRV